MPTKFHLTQCSGLRGVALIQTVYYDIQYIAKILGSKGPKFPEKKMKSENSGNMHMRVV